MNNLFQYNKLARKEFFRGWHSGISDDLLAQILQNTDNKKLMFAIVKSKRYWYKFYDLLRNTNFNTNKNLLLKMKSVLQNRNVDLPSTVNSHLIAKINEYLKPAYFNNSKKKKLAYNE